MPVLRANCTGPGGCITDLLTLSPTTGDLLTDSPASSSLSNDTGNYLINAYVDLFRVPEVDLFFGVVSILCFAIGVPANTISLAFFLHKPDSDVEVMIMNLIG